MNRRDFIASTGAAVIAANTVLGQNSDVKNDDTFIELKKRIADKKTPLTWVFTGDSITHGALHTFGWRSYVEHFAERVRFEIARMNDVVINTGISGDMLHRLMANADRRIFRFQPDVISMNIGMNDCKNGGEGKDVFQKSLQMLFDGASKSGSILVLNTPNLIDFVKDSSRKALPDYVGIIRGFALKNRVPLVDHYAYWTKEVGTGARLSMWLNDGSIHPNNYGHLVLARKMFQDMDIFDKNSITCSRLFVP